MLLNRAPPSEMVIPAQQSLQFCLLLLKQALLFLKKFLHAFVEILRRFQQVLVFPQ